MASVTVTAEDIKAIARRRRELEETVQDAKEALSAQQETILALTSRLVDADDVAAEEAMPAARKRLRELAAAVKDAALQLQEYNSENPTAKQLAEREAALALQREQEEQRPIAEAFKQTVRRRLAILAEFKEIENQARELLVNAEHRWRYSSDGLPACAGISAGLVDFLPREFWSPLGGRHDQIKEIAAKWDPEFTHGNPTPLLRAYDLLTGMKRIE